MYNRREAEEAAIARVRAAVDGVQAALTRYWGTHGTPLANGALECRDIPPALLDKLNVLADSRGIVRDRKRHDR